MSSGPSALTDNAWGRGDLYTLAIGILIFGVAFCFHFKTIKKSENHKATIIIELMVTAISLGPLVMILIDPLIKQFVNLDLLGLVLTQCRMTLWLAAFMACVNGAVGLSRSREHLVGQTV
jgi:hypothetical protein